MTDAERASDDIRLGVLHANVRMGEAIQDSELVVQMDRFTKARRVHFLDPDSQTPVASPAIEGEGNVVAEPAVWEVAQSAIDWDGVNNDIGKLSGDPFTYGQGLIKSFEQTTHNSAAYIMLDGAIEIDTSGKSPASHDTNVEAETLARKSEDGSMVMEKTGQDTLQPVVDMGDGYVLSMSADVLAPLADRLKSVGERGEDNVTVELPARMVSQPENAVIQPQKLAEEPGEQIAMAEVPKSTATQSTVEVGKRDLPVVSPPTSQDPTEYIKVPDSTMDKFKPLKWPFKDVNEHSSHKQQRIDTTLADSSTKRPVEFVTGHPSPKRQPINVSPTISSPKWPIQGEHEQPTFKRQHTDATSVSSFNNWDFERVDEQTAAKRQHIAPRISRDGSKAEPEHPTSLAPSLISNMIDRNSLTVANLRKQLSKRGLSTKGVETLLVQHLTENDQAVSQAKDEPAGEEEGCLTLLKVDSTTMNQGREPEQIGEAIAHKVTGSVNDVAATAEDHFINKVAEEIVKDIVEEIVADAVKPMDFTNGRVTGNNVIWQVHELNNTATLGSSADADVQDDIDVQDDADTSEEVVLLVGPDEDSNTVKHEEHADISLESVEAPRAETGARDGPRPRFTGSETAWKGLQAFTDRSRSPPITKTTPKRKTPATTPEGYMTRIRAKRVRRS